MTSSLYAVVCFADFIDKLSVCSGLSNDHVAETFLLRHTIDGNSFPCRYVRIGKCSTVSTALFVMFLLQCSLFDCSFLSCLSIL